jgi:1,4-dihydroxy-2-naphthoate octaprenyltransferase
MIKHWIEAMRLRTLPVSIAGVLIMCFAAVGKRTTVVIFGRKAMSVAYLLSGFIGMSVMTPVWLDRPVWVLS